MEFEFIEAEDDQGFVVVETKRHTGEDDEKGPLPQDLQRASKHFQPHLGAMGDNTNVPPPQVVVNVRNTTSKREIMQIFLENFHYGMNNPNGTGLLVIPHYDAMEGSWRMAVFQKRDDSWVFMTLSDILRELPAAQNMEAFPVAFESAAASSQFLLSAEVYDYIFGPRFHKIEHEQSCQLVQAKTAKQILADAQYCMKKDAKTKVLLAALRDSEALAGTICEMIPRRSNTNTRAVVHMRKQSPAIQIRFAAKVGSVKGVLLVYDVEGCGCVCRLQCREMQVLEEESVKLFSPVSGAQKKKVV